jgi:sugar phosphate isomerase/epimerase
MGALSEAGYDGVLSIEHEDPAMSAIEGVEKSVELLRRVLAHPRRANAAH